MTKAKHGPGQGEVANLHDPLSLGMWGGFKEIRRTATLPGLRHAKDG